MGEGLVPEKHGTKSWFKAQKVKGKENKMRLKREEGTDHAVCIGYHRA